MKFITQDDKCNIHDTRTIRPLPWQGNQLVEYYLIAGHQKDLNPHIQQVHKHLFQELHRSPQPNQKQEREKWKKKKDNHIWSRTRDQGQEEKMTILR